jgi:solute:Na+ symporter, SSS family
VWTDVLQTGVYLLGGLAAVYLIGAGIEGGWGAVLERAGAAGKLRVFDFYTGFDRAHTVFAGLIGGAFLSMLSSSRSSRSSSRSVSASGHSTMREHFPPPM